MHLNYIQKRAILAMLTKAVSGAVKLNMKAGIYRESVGNHYANLFRRRLALFNL